MKVKYLINKKTGEFAEIINISGCPMIFTSQLPTMPLNPNADNDVILKQLSESDNLDLSEYNVVEFDVVESGKIGADIRNKLSPIKNLISVTEMIDENDIENPKFIRWIKRDSKKCRKSIKYLSNLL